MSPLTIIRKPPISENTTLLDRITEAALKQSKDEIKKYEPFRNEYKHGLYDSDEDKVTANFTFALVNMLLAFLNANLPTVECDPRGGGDKQFKLLVDLGVFPDMRSARRKFADTLETVVKHAYEETNAIEANEACLQEALLTGLGYTKQSFDAARQCPRADALMRHEVYVDPHARYSLRQARYICQTVEDPIEQAIDFFDNLGVKGIEPNWTLADGESMRAKAAKKNAPENGDKDLFKYYEIWIKERDRNVLVYRTFDTHRTLLKREWPFQLTLDEFPFAALMFNQLHTQISDAFPVLEVIQSLRKSQQKYFELNHKAVLRSLARKLLYDDAMIDEGKLKKALSSKDTEPVPINTQNGTKALDKALFMMEFNSKSDPSLEMSAAMKATADEITGQDELMRGAEVNDMTAEEARIRDANSKLRTGRSTSFYDKFLNVQASQMAQIARQLMPKEKVLQISEDDEDGGFLVGLLWDLHAADAEDFKCAYSVGVAAGSTGQLAKDERMNRWNRFRNVANEENANAFAVGKNPIWDTNQISEEIIREDKVRNPDRFKYPADAFPPPQQIDPMTGQPIPAAPIDPMMAQMQGSAVPSAGLPPSAAPVAEAPAPPAVVDPNNPAAATPQGVA